MPRPLSHSILLWGMPSPFTHAVFRTLQQAKIDVRALIIAGGTRHGDIRHGDTVRTSGDPRPILPPPTASGELLLYNANPANPIQLAWDQRIPVFAVSDLKAPAVLNRLQVLCSMDQSVNCLACFPKRIPAPLLDRSPHGFLNVHPSLLPANRGPYPIFWQLRAGAEAIGITVHQTDAQLDTGPIARQTLVALPSGITGPAIDRILGTAGGRLLATTLRALWHGTQRFFPQPARGSYQGRPVATDFALDVRWTARHAFNFLRGTSEWGLSYTFSTDDGMLRIASAMACQPTESQPAPIIYHNGAISIQFAQGLLVVRPH